MKHAVDEVLTTALRSMSSQNDAPFHRAGNTTLQRRNAILDHKADQAGVSATLLTTGDQPFPSKGHNGCCRMVRGPHV